MTIVNWDKFPNVKKLVDKILYHRRKCNGWNSRTPCYNCHFEMIGKVEEDLEKFV